jgi:hypothetical protein
MQEARPIQRQLTLRTSELRSAYLVRAGVVRYDVGDAENLRRQLRRHFDVVISLLVVSTPTSIEHALIRLENASGTRWSDVERDRVGRQLLAMRYLQLLRLKAYRDRGVFPLNEGHASSATPIFVDEHDTACAVGQLMRLSGWTREVASIQKANNLIYVTDIEDGPAADWVLTSGLTIEEAALIQPAYGNFPMYPLPVPIDAVRPNEPGWSAVLDDLRFSNFRYYTDAESPPSVNANVAHSLCEGFSCISLPRTEDYVGTALRMGWFGSGELIPFDWHVEYERVVIEFDVETVLPSQRIVGSPNAHTAYSGGGSLIGPAQQGFPTWPNSFQLFAGRDADDSLIYDPPNFDGRIDLYPYPIVFSTGVLYDPQSPSLSRRMTVVTEMLVRDGEPYQAQWLNFEIVSVPEPNAMMLLTFALVAGVHWRRITRPACGR